MKYWLYLLQSLLATVDAPDAIITEIDTCEACLTLMLFCFFFFFFAGKGCQNVIFQVHKITERSRSIYKRQRCFLFAMDGHSTHTEKKRSGPTTLANSQTKLQGETICQLWMAAGCNTWVSEPNLSQIARVVACRLFCCSRSTILEPLRVAEECEWGEMDVDTTQTERGGGLWHNCHWTWYEPNKKTHPLLLRNSSHLAILVLCIRPSSSPIQ